MDTNQMKYFLTAAICLNFTEAAVQLHVTQPTLSRHITAIESELNVQLFIRDNRSLRLTQAGKFLYEKLSALYGEYCDIVEMTRDKSFGITGTLNVGVLDGIVVSALLPEVLAKIRKKHPDIRVGLSRGSFRSLVDGLYKRSADVAILLEFDVQTRDKIRYRRLLPSVDGVAMHASHPKAGCELVSLSDFRDDTVILLSKEDAPNAAPIFLEECRKLGFYPHNCVYAPNQQTSMLMVEAGVGVAVVSDHNNLLHNPGVRFVPLDVDWPTSLVAAWHQENHSTVIETLLGGLPQMA